MPPWAAMPFSIAPIACSRIAVMDVAATAIRRREGGQSALVLCGAFEIRRAGEQFRDRLAQQVRDVAGGLDAGLGEPLRARAALEVA